MTIEFKLPDLGENIEAGDVITVLVSVGDTIQEDQPVLELETDKATLEVPSSVSGVIKEIHIKAGDEAKVGQTILTVEGDNGQTAPEQRSTPEETAVPEPAEPEPEPEPTPQPKPAGATAPEPVADVPSTNAAPALLEFKLPDLGENIESGDVISVLVAVGDTIREDQPVLELETDKATLEVPSAVSGVIKEIHVKAGDEAKVGQLLLTVEGVAATSPAASSSTSTPVPEVKAEPIPEPKPSSSPAPAPTAAPAPAPVVAQAPVAAGTTLHKIAPAAPSIRRLARELGVNIKQIPGTGPAGRISEKDVKNYVKGLNLNRPPTPSPAAAPTVVAAAAEPELPDFTKWGEVERERMSAIRRATARQMNLAWTHIPHVTNFDKVDITELEILRKKYGRRAEAAGAKLTITAIILKVVASALKQFPKLNATIDMTNQEVIYKKYYHIGVAVDTERGLVVPAIRDVDQKSIIELAVELNELAVKARDRKLKIEDLQGSTFTITNLGGIGGTNFTPIINHPEVAILGVARGGREPVYIDGAFEPRLMMPINLSYDHRLIDGADAARFLRWVAEALEQPFLLALGG